MVTIEGVDYSRTPNANWSALAAALRANGKRFVGRYAVSDKSPNGRGITRAEYQAMTAAGIEVFVYWEAQTSWMLGGYDAGARAAENALVNLREAGMPRDMPVYYSHDIEPAAVHFDEVDACLRGAASVVGFDAVGLYGGYGIIQHVADVSHTAPWFCQTYAWSGSRVHPASHLYQYDNYDNYIAGTDVDLVRALKTEYGQASSFINRPTTSTTTTAPPPVYPTKRIPAPDTLLAQGHELTKNETIRFRCIDNTLFRTAPSMNAPAAVKTPAAVGKTYTMPYKTIVDGVTWYVSNAGSWARAKHFTAV